MGAGQMIPGGDQRVVVVAVEGREPHAGIDEDIVDFLRPRDADLRWFTAQGPFSFRGDMPHLRDCRSPAHLRQRLRSPAHRIGQKLLAVVRQLSAGLIGVPGERGERGCFPTGKWNSILPGVRTSASRLQ